MVESLTQTPFDWFLCTYTGESVLLLNLTHKRARREHVGRALAPRNRHTHTGEQTRKHESI